jgi:hypothetical protein
MKLNYAFVILALSTIFGCSTSSPASTADDAGVSAETAALCASACTVAKTCAPALEETACQTQCAKEVAGKGYLHVDFAKEFMTKLAAAKTDDACGISRSMNIWSSPPSLDAPGVKECIAYATKCDSTSAPLDCTRYYYVWNEATRSKVAECFSVAIPPGTPPCSVTDACFAKKLGETAWSAGGAPWLAIPCTPGAPPFGDCPK